VLVMAQQPSFGSLAPGQDWQLNWQSPTIPQRIGQRVFGSIAPYVGDKWGQRAADVAEFGADLLPGMGMAEGNRKFAETGQTPSWLDRGMMAVETIPGAKAVSKPVRKGIRTLYHGTSPEAADEIVRSKKVMAPFYMTPRRDAAEGYGSGALLELKVPEIDLMVDLDLPGGQLLDVGSAAGYLGLPPETTISDILELGKSVGIQNPESLLEIIRR